jgi:hypothetical protein
VGDSCWLRREARSWVPGQPVTSPATAGRDPTDGVGRKAVAEKRSRCARLTNPSSVGTVRQLIDALSLTLEKLIKQGGQQQ